ncbi:NADPH2:quinone reductase [Agrobacterium tumefaciens]|uniref:NAD(P)H-quinone oxidoreductase n=1 Tax=Agrobacterium TaxID=357 RepID=UPI000DCFD251|nr:MULTISPECIES: NAD(P)H-quinone oxidoreductase [Agrobacterium]MBP2511605.1 NADPH2:quinone reductase [Agrobacterium tumefaciens]MBP2520814.1 NADPH2:quinone reductase [Agrobacterium tumefaciens]MBP2577346.1 NADPH2:quinone reductase [Agrobacterium tumefaciens]MBP2596287.1 NADPH2:quinone reductase [Agrobacterium tumefaciens]
MKAIVFDEFGSSDVLRLAEAPMPEVRPDDLLVKVMAAGVNRADLLQREGVYGSQSYGDSDVLGLEVAGEVMDAGNAVTGFAVGDRVMGIVGGGAYAQYARLDSGMATAIPAGMSFTDAAAVMESFVTAWEALAHLGRVAEGEIVLIHAAAGGIGSAAVQLAKAVGATVLATASGNNVENVLALGADAVFDYKRVDFEAEIIDVTASHGADLIIDFVGGSYLARNIRSLAPGGRLVQVGLLGRDGDAIIPLGTVLHNHLQLLGTVMKSRSRSEKRAMICRFRDDVLPMMGKELQPVVGALYPLSATSDAHRRMEAGGVFGKIVLGDFHE